MKSSLSLFENILSVATMMSIWCSQNVLCIEEARVFATASESEGIIGLRESDFPRLRLVFVPGVLLPFMSLDDSPVHDARNLRCTGGMLLVCKIHQLQLGGG